MRPRRTHCRHCGSPLSQPQRAGRPRQYCCEGCGREYRRKAAQRAREADLVERSAPEVDAWLLECGLKN